MKKVSPELRLLAASASYYSDKDAFLTLKNQQTINWGTFYELTQRHRVLPMVVHNLNRWGITLEINQQLTIACLKHKKLALQQTALLFEINSLLRKEGIPCIHFKGPSLASLLYGDTTLRQYKDIDILVEPTLIDEAYQALLANQFETQTPLYNKDYLNKEYKKHTKDYIFSKNGCQIELHWSLLKIFNIAIDEKFEKHIAEITLNGKILLIFKDSYYLTYLILHGYISGWARLHWLVDVYDFVKTKQIDWGLLENMIASSGHIEALYEIAELLNRFFNYEIPIHATNLLKNKKTINNSLALINLPITTKTLSKYNILVKYRQIFLLQKGIIQKLKTSKRILLTSEKDWHLLNLPKPLFFLYYPLRPIFWLTRKAFPNIAKNSAKKS